MVVLRFVGIAVVAALAYCIVVTLLDSFDTSSIAIAIGCGVVIAIVDVVMRRKKTEQRGREKGSD